MAEDTIIYSIFEGEKSDQQNALITALMECGKDFAKSNNRLPHENSVYDWMEKTEKKAMVTEVISKLNDLGYLIVKK